jgi:hypothetical protein
MPASKPRIRVRRLLQKLRARIGPEPIHFRTAANSSTAGGLADMVLPRPYPPSPAFLTRCTRLVFCEFAT